MLVTGEGGERMRVGCMGIKTKYDIFSDFNKLAPSRRAKQIKL